MHARLYLWVAFSKDRENNTATFKAYTSVEKKKLVASGTVPLKRLMELIDRKRFVRERYYFRGGGISSILYAPETNEIEITFVVEGKHMDVIAGNVDSIQRELFGFVR